MWLGCSKIGAVPALINYNLRGQSLLHRWDPVLSALIEWSFVYFFFQHSLGLCHCDHLWWRVDLCSKRHPERAWQGCEADVLGQVSIVEYSQIRTLKHLPHQVPKWSQSESGGGSIASWILRCEPFSCRQFIWTMSYQTSRPQMSRIRSVKGWASGTRWAAAEWWTSFSSCPTRWWTCCATCPWTTRWWTCSPTCPQVLYIYTSGTTGLPKAAVVKNSRSGDRMPWHQIPTWPTCQSQHQIL